jgi:CII-binding regulator of phage lambda lysogenization HflD
MTKKQKTCADKTTKKIATLHTLLKTVKEQIKEERNAGSEMHLGSLFYSLLHLKKVLSLTWLVGKKLETLQKNIKQLAAQVSDEQKELHGMMNKYGKAIEKVMPSQGVQVFLEDEGFSHNSGYRSLTRILALETGLTFLRAKRT